MKILCICANGNSRSVALAYILKEELGHEAIAVGFYTAKKETRKMLCEWADRIIVCYRGKQHWIEEEYRHKLKIYDVGPYFLGYKQELLNQFYNYLKTDPL